MPGVGRGGAGCDRRRGAATAKRIDPEQTVRRLIRGPRLGQFDVVEDARPDWPATLSLASTAVAPAALAAALVQAAEQELMVRVRASDPGDLLWRSVLTPV